MLLAAMLMGEASVVVAEVVAAVGGGCRGGVACGLLAQGWRISGALVVSSNTSFARSRKRRSRSFSADRLSIQKTFPPKNPSV